MEIAVLDINFHTLKTGEVIGLQCDAASIYDVNKECVVSGPAAEITLEDLANFLDNYDIVFFKGGIVEVGFIRRFVGDDLRLINMEKLGCPNYDQLVNNNDFLEATTLDLDPQTCVDHQGAEKMLHCVTSEVSAFGNWLLLKDEEKRDL